MQTNKPQTINHSQFPFHQHPPHPNQMYKTLFYAPLKRRIRPINRTRHITMFDRTVMNKIHMALVAFQNYHTISMPFSRNAFLYNMTVGIRSINIPKPNIKHIFNSVGVNTPSLYKRNIVP